MWQKELEVGRTAIQAAGDILSRHLGQVNHIMKKGEIDLVTEADIQAEKAVLDILRQAYPDDSILSEEAGERERSSHRTWVIDPLDGTTNFAHAFPFFAVSIALEVRGKTVLGLVSNPYMNEHFEALAGAGAKLNAKPIRVSTTRRVKDALIGTGFPYDVHEKPDRVMSLFRKMIVAAQGIRRPGSAAIDLCYVAAGRLDGFWEQGLKPWDTAAGALIVEEAGGILSTIDGGPYSPYSETILAGNPYIHEEMMRILAE